MRMKGVQIFFARNVDKSDILNCNVHSTSWKIFVCFAKILRLTLVMRLNGVQILFARTVEKMDILNGIALSAMTIYQYPFYPMKYC